jgi:GAF domain-containing protein
LLANTSAFIYQSFNQLDWAGFYLADDNKKILNLGPFQGKVACIKIPYSKGVCGACARENKTIVVADVHQFPGHIACDNASNSEIVIPINVNNKFYGELDIDSPIINRFSDTDKTILESIVEILISKLTSFKIF